MRFVYLLVVLSACGSVTKTSDAGRDSAGHGDAPADVVAGDAPAGTITAIGAGNVTEFTVPANGSMPIAYVAEYDDLAEWSNTDSTFTAKTAGDYFVCASVFAGGNNLNSPMILELSKNGTVVAILSQAFGIASGCRAVRLAASDKLQLIVVNNQSAAGLTIPPDPNWQWMSIERVTEVAAATTGASFASPNGSFVQIPYSSATINDGSLYNANTHQLTAATAGDFQICASSGIGGPTIEGEIDLFLNNTTREKTLSNGVGIASGCRSVRLAANDVVDVRLFQNTTSATVASGATTNWLDIQKQPISVSVGAIGALTTVTQMFKQVPYTTVLFDDSGQFSSTNHTFVPMAAGDYEVCASLLVPQSTTDGDEIDIYKNGTREKGLSYGHFGLSGCRVMRLAAGDQVQIWTLTLGGKTFANDANWDWFEVSKLR